MKSTSQNPNCPYCLSSIEPNDNVVRCPRCGVMHHAECWKLNGQCSVYGCDGWAIWNQRISDKISPSSPKRIDIAQGSLVNSSQESPCCIKCGKPVGRNEVVCWQCRRAAFGKHIFENCLGPAVVALVAAAATILSVIRLF